MVEDEHSEPGAGVAADAAVRVEIGIEIIDGPDRHVRYDAGGPEMTIGTSPENDLVLTDPSVAAHHLWLRVRDGPATAWTTSISPVRYSVERATQDDGDEPAVSRSAGHREARSA